MADEFRPYGVVHLVVVVAALAILVALVRRARRVKGSPEERPFRLRLGMAILAGNLAMQTYRLLPAHWNPDVSLPLHLCDFAWMAAAWSILSRRDGPGWLVYYWGLGLSWQAFLTPTVDDGFAHPEFWAFWFLHGGIVAVALVNAFAFGPRPSWRGFVFTVATTLVLFLAVLGVNLALDTPYFFNSPDDGHVEGTPIALLGAWPLRLVWLGLIVIGLFALMTWPWLRGGRGAGEGSVPPPTA
ncbi:MAG: TIGR02206 family membrane protein [Planctomycetota bacterium]